MTVVTRFAPSPTGTLHIGGARTALFNWLFARHHAGRFLLRIEDTDRARSTPEAVGAILDGLGWLGLDWDGDAQSQFDSVKRHAGVACRLLAEGKAYQCFCTPDELNEMRQAARREGRSMRYDGRWRDRDPATAPPGVDPVIRLKMPQVGTTVIDDKVQGEIEVANDQLDDLILLRADGTPTYMLAVVVDDHEAGVTHVIRGDDHLTNAFRQLQIYRALDWEVPAFAHVPLLHGPDGSKLSKRHGALGVGEYRDQGYLPEAMRNYLLRLGWSHGDDEIIDTEQAIAWFSLDAIGRSPARFDKDRLDSLNAHYLRHADDGRLADLVLTGLDVKPARGIADEAPNRLIMGMPGLKERATTLVDLTDSAAFYARLRPLTLDDKAAKLLDSTALGHLKGLREQLAELPEWSDGAIEVLVRRFAEDQGLKLGKIAQPLRAALTGAAVSPPVFEVMRVLGEEETLGRLDDVIGGF
ncbi:MAG: glutamate--tRNA ligase [Rhodospirillales bacterium]|jgi:glutamyl-tRNA synthetase|nr:glutamate--tRNA ligase [Rhodospirillales bacterium]